MALQPITYRGEVLAAASPTRFLLSDELRRRRAGDPELTFVLYMTVFAREILAGELPGVYSDERALRYARAALIPDELLERPLISRTPHEHSRSRSTSSPKRYASTRRTSRAPFASWARAVPSQCSRPTGRVGSGNGTAPRGAQNQEAPHGFAHPHRAGQGRA